MPDVNLRTYIDQTSSIMEGVFLAYNGKADSVQIANMAGDMPIKKIGDGAFANTATIKQLVLDEGILEIGAKSFSGCKNLLEVTLPSSINDVALNAFAACNNLKKIIIKRELSKDAYAELLRNAIDRGTGNYILASADQALKYVKPALDGISTVANPAYCIEAGMKYIVVKDGACRPDLRGQLMAMDLAGVNVPRIEQDIVREKIACDVVEPYHEPTERQVENYMVLNKSHVLENVAIVSFYKDKTEENGGKYCVTFDIDIGVFFWPSTKHIRFGGREYYIYRRMVLNSGQDLWYVCDGMYVVNNEGEIRKANEAADVLAKYKLLSML